MKYRCPFCILFCYTSAHTQSKRRYSIFQQKFLSFFFLFSFAAESSRSLDRQATFISQKIIYCDGLQHIEKIGKKMGGYMLIIFAFACMRDVTSRCCNRRQFSKQQGSSLQTGVKDTAWNFSLRVQNYVLFITTQAVNHYDGGSVPTMLLRHVRRQ